MPFAQVHITEGHSPGQKRVLIEEITQAVHDSIGAPKPKQIPDNITALNNTTFTADELESIDKASGLYKE